MIIQKDLKGNYIASFKSKTEAARAIGADESLVRKAIKRNRVVYGLYRYSISNELSEPTVIQPKGARILLVDIETSPVRAYVWSLWKQNVYLDQIISNWFMLSWSAKWLGEEEIYSNVLTSREAVEENDLRIVKDLWKLLDEADVVVGHNSNQFDIPKMNSRFVVNGLVPPSPYKMVDTKIISKNQFGFSSNKLQALAELFGIEGKFDTDFKLWDSCMWGDEKALLEMMLYNRQDVVVLENVYLKLRPYAKGHANLDLYVDSDIPTCPHCGSKHITLMPDKYFYTQAVRYQTYRCECGAISRSKTGTKYENKKVITSIPR
jgi:hypothetical protein